MGEARKRKVSAEKSNAAEKPVVASGGGLGLIPVVLIAAVLAGSGCFVIKKDHAENFANIQTLTDQLRADNVNTIKTVAAMKKSIDQKDSIIKELQQKVTAGNEKNRLMEEKMGDLNELLQSTEEKLSSDIDAKYEDNMNKIKKFASEIGDHSNRILQSNNRMDKTDEKLDDVIKQVTDGAVAAGTRQSEIAALEAALQETKAAGAAATTELKQLVEDNTADTGALDIQAAQLSEVNGQIDELNAKIQEGAVKIAQLNAETVAINAKIEDVEAGAQSADAAIHEIKTVGGAELEELKATIPALQAQIELFAENIEEISATIPSQSLLVTLQATTQKAADGLAQASKDIQENSLELRTIRTDAEKELAALAARIGGIVDDVKQGDTVAKTLNESIDSANQIIGALTSDIDGLKKKHSDLSKKISAK